MAGSACVHKMLRGGGGGKENRRRVHSRHNRRVVALNDPDAYKMHGISL